MEEKFGMQLSAWCTDDGPDGKKMRWLLQALFTWLIVILCWVHQINFVVGDFLAIQQSVMDDINHALEVIKWFNNHSTALALLQTEQTLTFKGLFWALILPAITWWTTTLPLPVTSNWSSPCRSVGHEVRTGSSLAQGLSRNYRRRWGISVHWFGMNSFGINWESEWYFDDM